MGLWDGVETPALVVDEDRMKENARRMLRTVREQGVSLRPHVKTHKTIEGAFFQLFGDDAVALRTERLANASCKIAVSTLGEAEFFAAAGFQDILYAVFLAANWTGHTP